jgi:hypothetical protein
MKKETFIVCDYGEIESLITKEVGIDEYNIPYNCNFDNDTSCVIMDVTPTFKDNLRELLINKKQCSLHSIIYWLCSLGKLPSGNYLIIISW